jgi:hypothetical protein
MSEDRHDDVMSSLLDLQARLRGVGEQPPEGVFRLPTEGADPGELSAPDESVSVFEDDLRVSETLGSEPALASVTQLPTVGADDRVAALSARLERLEDELASVIVRIDRADEPGSAPAASPRSAMDDHLVRLQQEIARKLDEERDPNR